MLALLQTMILSQVGCGRRATKTSDAKDFVASAGLPSKAAVDDVQSDAETESTVEGDYTSDDCSSDEDAGPPGLCRYLGPRAAARATNVLSRNQLLAMMPQGPLRTGGREETNLPFALPIASLATAPRRARQRGLTDPAGRALGTAARPEVGDFIRGLAEGIAHADECSAAPSPTCGRVVLEKPPLAPPPGLELPHESSMSKDLALLRLHNPEHILKVRGLKKLGWEAVALLRKHSEQFGGVLEVYATPSLVKPNPKRPGGRTRPAHVGFIVMADDEGMAAALAGGQEQLVSGASVEVSTFNPFLNSHLDGADA